MIRTPFKILLAIIIGCIGFCGYALYSTSTASMLSNIYSSTPNSKQSNAYITSFADGVWTYTKSGGAEWIRYTFDGAGRYSEQIALPTSDDWGKVSSAGHIQPETGKFTDTGERWFGFKLIQDSGDDTSDSNNGGTVGELVINKGDGTLVNVDVGIFDHKDVNPFSK